MKTAGLFLAFSFSLMAIQTISSQAPEGLWLIETVTVGSENMTPVARWTRINSDGSYESGNGWLQNAKGTWRYDDQEQTFLPKQIGGIKDHFGPFEVSTEEDRMHWQRTEDGQLVKISFKKIEELPMAPADRVTGLWDLTSVTRNGEDYTAPIDPDGKYYIFFRWDRIFVERNAQGNRSTGYWHMNGHRPHITLLSHQKGVEPLTWEVFFEKDTLKMKGLSDSNKDEIRSFKRLDDFPG